MATRGQRLLAAGATITIAEPILMALHQGGLGAVCGLGLGIAVAASIDEIEKLAGREIPSLPVPKIPTQDPNTPSIWYRVINGKSTRGDERRENAQVANGEAVFPKYRDDETLRLGTAIDREALATLTAAYQADPMSRLPHVPGQRFEPHIDGLFGKSMILAAVPGSGKSMLIGLITEQIGECDAPAIVLEKSRPLTHSVRFAPCYLR